MGPCLILLIVFSSAWATPLAEVHTIWNNFKLSHGKSFDSPQEESYRLQVFHENLKKIEEHNKLYDAGLSTYQMGVTKFADLTADEYVARTSSLMNSPKSNVSKIFRAQEDEDLPTHVDWREKGAVNVVINQGKCGSCWAVTAVAVLESLVYIKTGRMFSLSVQNLVDCAGSFGNFGCKGGILQGAYDYIKANGIMLDSEYPYTEKDGECKFKSERAAIWVTDSVRVEPNEQALKTAIAKVGPVGVIVTTREWPLYKKGILVAKEPFVGINHVVPVVGYGTENGVDYWILKNSEGKDFGEDGYIRVARNIGESIGVTADPVYPTINY